MDDRPGLLDAVTVRCFNSWHAVTMLLDCKYMNLGKRKRKKSTNKIELYMCVCVCIYIYKKILNTMELLIDRAIFIFSLV